MSPCSRFHSDDHLEPEGRRRAVADIFANAILRLLSDLDRILRGELTPSGPENGLDSSDASRPVEPADGSWRFGSR